MALGIYDFERRIKRINPNFYIKRHSYPVEVLDVDNRGEHYVVMKIEAPGPNGGGCGYGSIEWLKEADMNRRRKTQVEAALEHKKRVEAREERERAERHVQNMAMAKDLRPAVARDADEMGVRSSKPTILEPGWNNKFYSSGI